MNSLCGYGQGRFVLLSFGLLRLVHLRDLFGALFGGSLSLEGGVLGGRLGRGRGVRDLFKGCSARAVPLSFIKGRAGERTVSLTWVTSCSENRQILGF